MDLLSIPEYVIKKGRPHGHRYGKKPGDKENYIANQLKKKCKKRCFQCIHDRFIRDEQVRSRMIENGRNEDACRQMDVLAEEDHTHHLTSQEHFYYKSNWWLRSNKTGSDTLPVQRRSYFKQALSTLQQLKERRSSTKPAMGTKFFFFFMVELAKFLVDSLFLWKSPWRWTKYWLNRATCYARIWKQFILQGMIFLNSFTLLQMDRLQLSAVYCNWRGVNTTPQMTYFFCAKRVQNGYREKWWWIVAAWQQDENLDTKWKIYEWVTKHNANASDDMYPCVTLHYTNVNDDIHACVALHNAHTCNHIHWAPCTFLR